MKSINMHISYVYPGFFFSTLVLLRNPVHFHQPRPFSSTPAIFINHGHFHQPRPFSSTPAIFINPDHFHQPRPFSSTPANFISPGSEWTSFRDVKVNIRQITIVSKIISYIFQTCITSQFYLRNDERILTSI